MQLNPSEISELIKSKIQNLQGATEVRTQGTVVSVTDGICRVHGLADVMQGEMLEFPGNTFGMALNLERDSVGAVVLGEYEHITEGDTVKMYRPHSRSAGRPRTARPRGQCAGRADRRQGSDQCQGNRQDRKGRAGRDLAQVGVAAGADRPQVDRLHGADRPRPARADHRRPPDRQDSGGRRRHHQPEGQEPVLYLRRDRPEGLDRSTNVVRKLEEHGAMEYTIVVAATASESAAMQFIAPYSGCTMGEYFRDRGQDALIIYDDLTKQAWAYRQISLLLRRPPGREAYPGDVFYLHSRLLERAARVSEAWVEKLTNGEVKGKTGSLTALPVIETQAGDVSAFVPTNVISITDGQIFLETDLFNAGIRPAMNAGVSVSRVGGAAQTKVIKKLGGGVRLALAQYRELAAFAQFASDLDEATRKQLERGRRVTELMKQAQYSPLSVAEMAVSLYAINQGYFDDVEVPKHPRVRGRSASVHEARSTPR